MEQKCKTCNSCGMPLKALNDYALSSPNSEYCVYCTREDGSLKPYQEIVEGMTQYLIASQGIDKTVASTIAHQSLSRLPAWKTLKYEN